MRPRLVALLIVLFVGGSTTGCSDSGRRGGGSRLDLGSSGSDGGLPAGEDMGPCAEVIDVVFVLDVSSSMGFVLDKLDAEIAAVVDAANRLQPDAHFGLITFADNDALDTTGPLENGRVHTAAATLQAAFRSAKATYTNNNRNPGDGPSGPTTQNPICEENALDALADAAQAFPWRPNATRVVIAVTDDTFLERPDNYGDRDHDGRTDKTDYPREGDYPARFTVPEAVTALRDTRARVFSFTRLTPPGFLDRCGTGRRLPWTSITDGWSTNYGANPPIPVSTGGKNFDLEEVRTGRLSLSATINDVVVESYCNPIY